MPNLRIPSHMSGEQYITKAALISDPGTRVLLFSGTDMLMKDYKREAEHRGKTMLDLYNARTAGSGVAACVSLEEMKASIETQQKTNLARMYAFLRAGIQNPGRVTIHNGEGPAPTPETRGSTSAVADFYRENPDAASQLRETLFDDAAVSSRTKALIREWYRDKGFGFGAKYCLFWGRKSGEISGAGPYLDTNEIMLGQMMIAIRHKDPERKLVVIGDPVTVPQLLDGIAVPRFDIDLTKYWDGDFPGGRDTSAQLYFIDQIRTHNPDSISIGTNSGILEIPHLLGMKTLYLENNHLHLRKGLRWQLLAANYGKSANPSEEHSLRIQLAAVQKKQGRDTTALVDKLRFIETRKVDVLHQIRPGLQRFSTSTATELWVMRKSVFDEIRRWLTAPLIVSHAANPRHDAFLDLVVRAALADANEVQPSGQQRPAWTTIHAVKTEWEELHAAPFNGSVFKQAAALRQMASTMRNQHGLTHQEQAQFWETFNHAYIHTPESTPAPDAMAGYRGWLRDTEDIWAYVRSRPF